jgi:hypothetical protein
LHALNRELHERFYRGRYRLAMSLEMIANPENPLPSTKEACDNLAEPLEILCRSGMADDTLLVSAEYLRDYSTCNIRCRLLELDDEDPGWLSRTRVRWHLRRAVRITSFIAGDPALINAVLDDPHSEWWPMSPAECVPGPLFWARARDRVRWLQWQRSTASWQAAYNTACLYAALADAARKALADVAVEACVDAAEEVLAEAAEEGALADAAEEGALADAADEALADAERKACALELVLRDLEHRVIVSLRRAVDNPHSELERPSDWIDSDPDFQAMRDNPQIFRAFESFCADQVRQDYPDSIAGKCPVPHTTAVKSLAVHRTRLTREQFPGRSQLPGSSPWAITAAHED